MPDEYFQDSHAPVIRVEQFNNAYANWFRTFYWHKTFTTNFTNNEFVDNQNYQIVTVPDASYMGSLLEWDCAFDLSVIGLYDNIVTENTFIGKLGALFYINGGLAKVIGNNFSYNGRLTNT